VQVSESVEMTCNDSNAEVGSSLQNSITLMCSENGTFIPDSSFDEVKIDSLKKILSSKPRYCKLRSFNKSLLEAHLRFYRLLMKGKIEVKLIYSLLATPVKGQ
jgi:hypothetical protein